MILLPVALLLQAALCLASAATNYSVDDQDLLFHYSGHWERITNNLNRTGGNLDKNGGHMLTLYKSGSSATITYTFASVYFLAPLWPYPVSTDYGIDKNKPLKIDMQDHSVPATAGGNATVASRVVGQWTSTANKKHTIHVTIPPGGDFAVIDMFIFEVLNSDTSSTISSTSHSSTGSSTITTSRTASSSSSSSSSSPSSFSLLNPPSLSSSSSLLNSPSSSSSSSLLTSPSSSSSSSLLNSPSSSSSSSLLNSPSLSSSSSLLISSSLSTSTSLTSGQQIRSSTIGRDLAISMGVVGSSLAILLVFFLWRFCIRRKGRNGGIMIPMTPITPQYHPVPTIPENGTHYPLNDNSMSMGSDDATSHGLGIQNNNLQRHDRRHPITLSYDHGISSHTSGLEPTLYTNQLTPLLPHTQQIHHNPQERISTPSMVTDRPPMYCHNLISDDSAPVSSSSSFDNTNGKRDSPRIPANTPSYTAVAEPEDDLTSTTILERQEEIVSVWDSGYPQPLRFVSIA